MTDDIKTPQEAHDAMADAIYWLSGYAASRDDKHGSMADDLVGRLQEAQRYVWRKEESND